MPQREEVDRPAAVREIVGTSWSVGRTNCFGRLIGWPGRSDVLTVTPTSGRGQDGRRRRQDGLPGRYGGCDVSEAGGGLWSDVTDRSPTAAGPAVPLTVCGRQQLIAVSRRLAVAGDKIRTNKRTENIQSQF